MKMTFPLLGALALLTVVALPAFAGDAAAGAQKAAVCGACHGATGSSINPEWPNLAGQHEGYIVAQLQQFKLAKRDNPLMMPNATLLSDQDMQDLAEYFSAQSIVRSKFDADPAKVEQGRKIAQEAQCVACHQAGFKGLNEFPRLSRQKYPYIVKQLKDYRDGLRTNDNGVMASTAKNLSDEQIEALAHYLASI